MAQVKSDEAYIIGAAQKRFREQYRREKRRKKRNTAILMTLLVIVLTITTFLAGFVVSENQSSGMNNLMQPGDIVITNRLAYVIHTPQRGEVVTLSTTNENNEPAYACKRVIGLPGDEIDFENGNVYVNGARCIESYVSGQTEAEIAHVMVPEGSYYVLNDCRDDMSDSRSVTISSSSIAGNEIAVIHVPDVVKNNQVYQKMRMFCKQGARAVGQIEDSIFAK